jgi:diguanylate cyclase (GGDEF)-like protein/PAS domain S-box-containing protein
MTDFNDPQVYRTVLQTLHMGVYFVDQNRRIRFWNRGAERITGYLSQDVVGHFLRDHLLARSGEASQEDANSDDPIGLVFRDGKPSITEISILHKKGHRVPIVLRTIAIRDNDGSIFGAAESFFRNQAASNWTRRQAGLAEFRCLDEMIGIPRRSFMETQLRQNLTTFEEHHVPFGILVIQVDQMDQLRSKRGAAVVPAILRAVAETVENCLRPPDLLGCWSEHQVLAVLAECKESNVMRVGEMVRKMVAQSEMEWWGEAFSVTCAFGGAGCRTGDTWNSLVERADKSLHESTAKGGNCVITVP